MIRIVWRTDVHLADRAPSSRKDDWTETVLGKLRQVGGLARKVGASVVLDGGDFFHVKSPSRNTHDLVRKVADIHAGYPCPVFATIGNHDCVYGDLTYLDQQPLGVLFSSGVFQRLYDRYEVFIGQRSDGTVGIFPHDRESDSWLVGNPFDLRRPDGEPVVRVVGIPYHGSSYERERFDHIIRGQEDFLVVVAHLLASPTGGVLFEGEDVLRYADLAPLPPDVFCFGHWHKDQGVWDVGGKSFVNLGALTRGALTQDEMGRRPAVALLDFQMGQRVKVTCVRLNVAPAKDVFDEVGRARAEARTSTVDAFVDSMRRRLVQAKGRSVEEVVSGMGDVPSAVRERVLLYLERAKGERS